MEIIYLVSVSELTRCEIHRVFLCLDFICDLFIMKIDIISLLSGVNFEFSNR